MSKIVQTDVLALPPLYGSIDPEALNSLSTATTHRESLRGQIQFPYNDHLVIVSYNGNSAADIEIVPVIQ